MCYQLPASSSYQRHYDPQWYTLTPPQHPSQFSSPSLGPAASCWSSFSRLSTTTFRWTSSRQAARFYVDLSAGGPLTSPAFPAHQTLSQHPTTTANKATQPTSESGADSKINRYDRAKLLGKRWAGKTSDAGWLCERLRFVLFYSVLRLNCRRGRLRE